MSFLASKLLSVLVVVVRMVLVLLLVVVLKGGSGEGGREGWASHGDCYQYNTSKMVIIQNGINFI